MVFHGNVVPGNRPVSVKATLPREVTPKVVANFTARAHLLASFDNPNVAKVEGICIAPPKLLMVLEPIRVSAVDRCLCRTGTTRCRKDPEPQT